jgi:hypothetical protein
MPRKKKKPDLPKEILVLENKEKKNHEKWYADRDPLDIPSPSRILLCGGCNSGKTLTVKNLIARASPPFDNIYLLHCGGKYVAEYEPLDVIILDEIPTPDDQRFDGSEKTAIIIEDKCFENLTREDRKRFNRLFGYMSTHRFIQIYLTSQNFMDVPPSLRRMANFFILWKVRDTDLLKTIARRIGLDKKEMIALSRKYYEDYTDSLWFDNTPHSPYRIRRNGYEMIHLDEEDKETKSK